MSTIEEVRSLDAKWHYEYLACQHLGRGSLDRDDLRTPGEERRCLLCDKGEKREQR